MAWIGNNNKLRDTYHNICCKPIYSCIQGTIIVLQFKTSTYNTLHINFQQLVTAQNTSGSFKIKGEPHMACCHVLPTA